MRTIKILVGGVKIYDEGAYTVEIEDEGGGEFLTITELADSERMISINPEEWETLRTAIDGMIAGMN